MICFPLSAVDLAEIHFAWWIISSSCKRICTQECDDSQIWHWMTLVIMLKRVTMYTSPLKQLKYGCATLVWPKVLPQICTFWWTWARWYNRIQKVDRVRKNMFPGHTPHLEPGKKPIIQFTMINPHSMPMLTSLNRYHESITKTGYYGIWLYRGEWIRLLTTQ